MCPCYVEIYMDLECTSLPPLNFQMRIRMMISKDTKRYTFEHFIMGFTSVDVCVACIAWKTIQV